MIARRDYKTNLSNQLELKLHSFSYLVMSQMMEDDVVRHNVFGISYQCRAMLDFIFSRMNPILTNYNVVLG